MSDENDTNRSVPYREGLTPLQAATAIQAARINALDLLDTAEILYDLKRFSHSEALSILALEESSKAIFLLLVFLGFGNRGDHWRSYRNHMAKTHGLNIGIEARVRAEFPVIPREVAKAVGEQGPSPMDLEIAKQRAIYSDCLEIDGELKIHLPRNINHRRSAWDVFVKFGPWSTHSVITHQRNLRFG